MLRPTVIGITQPRDSAGNKVEPVGLLLRKLVQKRKPPFPLHPQAAAAGAPVLQHTGTNRAGTVTADEPTIFMSNQCPELDTDHAIWAADGQGCIGQT